jgi:radical SAM superfamily enzyme YgiQ (UPF0313 family)
MLVGFLAQGNLGLGYLAAVLRNKGYVVEIVDFELDDKRLAEIATSLNPLVIGFSLIFQLYVKRFDALITRLRLAGVECHITVGGHYPSLSYKQALDLMPGLDSVVRFEGEDTLLELVDMIGTGREWRRIRGIAYRRDGEAVTNPLRPLVTNLDSLPYPDREYEPQSILGHFVLPILASRGCARTCSFCSIHMFYRLAPGKVVRTRSPAQVVAEMRQLYDKRGITIFLFQDDDFPLFGPAWQRWAREFVAQMHSSGLVGRVLWKISCRADSVDQRLFMEMREAGLYFVYIGIESGSEAGLQTLHKQTTIEENVRAVSILKELDLAFQFGFMLFEPSSSFESIGENLGFLRRIVGDGSVAAAFCRMIPYDGTPIKDELIRAGRLKGDICHPSYDFIDPRLDEMYSYLTQVVDLRGWVHGTDSLAPQVNTAWSEVFILERLFPPLPDMAAYKQALRQLTKACNEVLFEIVADTALAFSDGVPSRWNSAKVNDECERIRNWLHSHRNAFILKHQDRLFDALPRRNVGEQVYS